jgi:anion-transporting  ArsA/GET3 family ATPase
MDVATFCSRANVVIVAGKGGVGKTTITAALGVSAARAGLDVLLVGLDDQRGLPDLFGLETALSYDDTELGTKELLGRGTGKIRGRVITSEAALLEYLATHGLARIAKRLVQTGTLDVISTAIPGIREVLVLGKLKQLELARVADLIIVDAPATGHALTFLTSSSGLLDAARGGPLRNQALQVVEMLSDGDRCSVMLVTIPEETPINELVESAFKLEDEVGIKLGPIVVNACFPIGEGLDLDVESAAAVVGETPSAEDATVLREAAIYANSRGTLELEQLTRLGTSLALDQLHLPLFFSATAGPKELDKLSTALSAAIENL